jgi:hypothetical protein
MNMNDGGKCQAESTLAYCQPVEGAGESRRERGLQKVACELCGAVVNRQHLKKHQTRDKCIAGRQDYQSKLSSHVAELSSDPPEEPALEYRVSVEDPTETPCPVAKRARGRMYSHVESMHAYRRRVEGAGESHRARSLQKVKCDLCGAEVNRQHLKTHQTRDKCITGRKDYQSTLPNHMAELLGDPPEESSEEEEEPASEYRVSMDDLTETPCPVANCPFRDARRLRMRAHFRSRHFQHTIIVEEEGLLPRCEQCGLFQRKVGAKHQKTAVCKRFTKVRKEREKSRKERENAIEYHRQNSQADLVHNFATV